MFTVGEFAAIAGVSVRTLHHYHQLDLLVPVHLDPSSGYRRYDASQLDRLHRIIRLRQLGIRLDQMPVLLDPGSEVDILARSLDERVDELEAEVSTRSAQLRAARILREELEHASNWHAIPVVTKHRPAVRAAVHGRYLGRLPHSWEEQATIHRELRLELREGMRSANARPAGHRIGFVDPVTLTVNIGVEIDPHVDTDAFEILDLPERDVATVVTTPPIDDPLLSQAVLDRWMDRHGYRPVGQYRNVALHQEFDRDGLTQHAVLEREWPIEAIITDRLGG